MGWVDSNNRPHSWSEQERTEPMFYYFRLEDQIPEHHLLHRIDRYVDSRFVRERLRDACSGFWDCRGDEAKGRGRGLC